MEKSKASCLLLMVLFASSTSTPNFELVHMTDSTTERSGSITLRCRNQLAEDLEVTQVKFWLNRTMACDSDLRERPDVRVIKVDAYNIKFNLTGKLEGNFTCGRLEARENGIVVEESRPVTLISLQTIVPVPGSLQTTFTATVGNTAVIQCPISPGALLQSYSVEWIRNNTLIAERANFQEVSTDRNKYDIDNAYSLVIHSIDANDSYSDYHCALFSLNPLTAVMQEVQTFPNRRISLSLIVFQDEVITISTQKPVSIVVRSPTEQPSFTCIANAPNITWTYTNSEGEEMNLTIDGVEHQIVSNASQQDGSFTTNSTITFLELNLPQNDSAVVKCKVIDSSGTTTAKPDGFFVITADYSCKLTTSYHQKDYSILFIGLITASICVLLIAVISVGLLIVVCCYHHRKVSNKYTMSSCNCVCI